MTVPSRALSSWVAWPRLVALVALVGMPATSRSAVVSGIQSGTASSTLAGVVSVPLATPVDTTRSVLIFQTRSSSTSPTASMLRGRLASSTTIEFTRVGLASGTINITWWVVSFSSGVRVQRGEVNQSASSTTNVTLPISVASLSRAFVTWSKTPGAFDGAGWASDDPIVGELTTTSNLQFRVATANTAHVISWQVIEFTDSADVDVQKGSITTMTSGTASVTATLPTPVDLDRTFVLVGFRTSGSGNDVGARLLRAQLTNATTITIDRSITGDAITEIVWQAVELRDGSTVQRGSAAFGNAVSTVPVTLAREVDPELAVPLASVQPVGGQNMGRSNLSSSSASARIGVGTVTAALSPTTLTLTRSYAPNFTADIGWFVVQFRRRRAALVD